MYKYYMCVSVCVCVFVCVFVCFSKFWGVGVYRCFLAAPASDIYESPCSKKNEKQFNVVRVRILAEYSTSKGR